MDRHVIPPPSPDEQMLAQFEAMLDPSSGRDAVLVTPGSRVPDVELPAGVERVGVQPYGFIYTSNSHLAGDLRKASIEGLFSDPSCGDRLIGWALFQAAGVNGVPVQADVAVLALNAAGVRVSEVLADSSDVRALSIAEAVMRSHAGPDGRVAMEPINDEQYLNQFLPWYDNGGGIPWTLRDLLPVNRLSAHAQLAR